MKQRSVTVYCASSDLLDSHYYEMATELGRFIGRSVFRCVCGGGCNGLMKALISGVNSVGGEVVGVAPRFMVDQGWIEKDVSDLIEVATMHERKQKMIELSDTFIALPGGIGTLDEFFELYTCVQLGLCKGRVFLFNYRGFYDGIISQLDRLEEDGFLSSKDRLNKRSVREFDELCAELIKE